MIAVAVMVMNVGTYGFQLVAARLVGLDQYGSIARLLAIQLVLSVLQLGLQATAARRIAANPDHLPEVEHNILALGWRASWALTLVMLAASPILVSAQHLNSIYPALLVAIGALPMNVMGAQAGILQGERRWAELSLVYLAAGVPRLVLGVIALAIRPTEGAALAAVAVGWVIPCVVGWYVLRRGRNSRPARTDRPQLREIGTEVAHGALALLAFFALSNIDIVMSSHILGKHGSGLYAGGLILTKAVLFMPQFVSIVAFPAMSTTARRRTVLLRSLMLVGLVGVICVAGALLLTDVAMIFVGGEKKYGAIHPDLWQFAVLGTLLAALQLLIYSVLARQSRRATLLLWVAVLVVAVVGWWHVTSLTGLLALMIVTDAVLVAVLVGLSLWTMREDDQATEAAAAPVA